MDSPLELPIAELTRAVKQGDISATEVARAALERIAGQHSLNAFLHVSEGPVLAAAAAVDERRARGEELGALAGVPMAVKDALTTLDAPTTCGSRILTRRGPDGKPGDGASGWR